MGRAAVPIATTARWRFRARSSRAELLRRLTRTLPPPPAPSPPGRGRRPPSEAGSPMRRTRHRSLPFLVAAALLVSAFAPGGTLGSARATVPAGGWIPRDPGTSGRPGGWQAVQWNFDGPFGVGAPRA